MRVFSYKIARDYGFAPNPFGGVCTLATCKPQIRSAAAIGDLIVGCGSSANKMPGRVIFAMRVDQKMNFDDYWNDENYRLKRPFFEGSLSRAYGDNIYHHDETRDWVQELSHHSYADGALNTNNSTRDLSSNNVLCGKDFVYWGRNAPLIPTDLRNFSGEDLYPNSRSHRVKFSAPFVEATKNWYDCIPQRGINGRPTDWK